ncbi:MAG: Fur family transcriptional regulator [Desulfuromonadaceae bacterium]|nr:Fur family transcriptional regulator [Desulfuromonadaceae bacterium]
MSIDMFESFLEERCLKVTHQRRLVYEEILALEENFDVDSLLLRLKQKGARVSKATIYRTIQLLMECGLLRRVQLSPDGAASDAVYAACPKGCAIDNLVCTECGKTIRFNKEAVCNVCADIAGQHGFALRSHCLNIFAVCPECQKKEGEE